GRPDSKTFCPLARAAEEFEMRFSPRIAPDRDLPESDATPAGPERLHGRLLGGEPACDVLREGTRMAPRPIELARREDAHQKSFAPAFEHFRDPSDLGQIQAEPHVHRFRPKNRAMRPVSGPAGVRSNSSRVASKRAEAWRRRSSITASNVSQRLGLSSSTGSSVSLLISMATTSVRARTVAVRGSPVKRLISPKAAPGSSIAIPRLSPPAP